MSNLKSFNINGTTASINTASSTENGLMSSDNYNKLSELDNDVSVLNNNGLVLKDSVITESVETWLDEHPEATTTVQDESITMSKLADGVLERKTNTSGKKYVILDKDKTINSQVVDTSTIYEIRYDFELTDFLYVPDNSELRYAGGKISRPANKYYYVSPSANSIIDSRCLDNALLTIDYKYNKNTTLEINEPFNATKIDYTNGTVSTNSGMIVQYMDIIANNPINITNDDMALDLYGLARIYGKDRFTGNISYCRINFRTVYASDFLKNADGTINSSAPYPDLYLIYEKAKAMLSTALENSSIKLVVDFDSVIVSNTILLHSNICLVSNTSTIIFINDSDIWNDTNNMNIFEISERSGLTTNYIEIGGFVVHINNTSYVNNIIYCAINDNVSWYIHDMTIYTNISGRYNKFLKINTTKYQQTVIDGSQSYSDNCILKNINITNPDTYNEKPYNVVLSHGDQFIIDGCQNIRAIIHGGDKILKNSIHCSITMLGGNLIIENCHNEQGHFSLLGSQCTVIGSDLGDAVGNDFHTIELDNDNLLNDFQTEFDASAGTNYTFTRYNKSSLTTINTRFAFNSVSECNGFKTKLYDIYSYEENNNIKIINSNHYYNWIDLNSGTFNVYSNVINHLFNEIKEDAVTLSISSAGYDYDSYFNSGWNTVDAWNVYKESLTGTYIIEVVNIMNLLDVDRLLGIKYDNHISEYTCNAADVYKFKMNEISYGNYLINLTIDSEDKYVVVSIKQHELGSSLFNYEIGKYALWGYSYIDGNIENINECTKLDIINNDNIRAYLTELPQYGTWTRGDECVIDNVTYRYDGTNWINLNTCELSSVNTSGSTADRPTPSNAGFMYFDTTLNKPVYYTGTGWVDATGTEV